MSDELQAEKMGIQFYRRYSKKEAATLLGISPATLQRKRFAGEITFLKISERTIQYFGRHLVEFILKSEQAIDTKNMQKIPKEPAIKPANKHALSPADILASAQRTLGKNSK